MGRLLRKGDRIRLKAPMLSGWKGTGTVTCDQATGDDTIQFCKDGNDPRGSNSIAARHEVVLLGDQEEGKEMKPRHFRTTCRMCGEPTNGTDLCRHHKAHAEGKAAQFGCIRGKHNTWSCGYCHDDEQRKGKEETIP